LWNSSIRVSRLICNCGITGFGTPFRVHQKTAPPVQPITRRPPRAWKRQRIRDAGPNTESFSHIYADEHSVKFYAETVCGPGEARAPLLSRAVFEPTLYGCGLCSPTHRLCTADPGTASSVRALLNWRCKMIFSPHGPVMSRYGPANMPLDPLRSHGISGPSCLDTGFTRSPIWVGWLVWTSYWQDREAELTRYAIVTRSSWGRRTQTMRSDGT
jgi:hypothetical protein